MPDRPDKNAGFGRSAWEDGSVPPAPASDPLREDERCDLVVVGAGFLGLSTALHAARAGKAVRVIEARGIGEGASGLNGGQVIPGLKYDPEWLIERFGAKQGEALIGFAAGTADAVFDLIRNERLDVPYCRSGWIQAAHTQAALEAAAERRRQWAARRADATLIDAEEIAALTGSSGYAGGWLDRRAGTVQPLALTRELARLATDAGVRVATETRATKLTRRDGTWSVETDAGGRVVAPAVVVAANAYADDLVPGLARSIVWLHSLQIATAALPPQLATAVLPGGQAVSDSRRILVYYRKCPDGRLVLGGRGRMAEPAAPEDWRHLRHAMLRLYPALAKVPIERRWYGRVAMTPDHLPHIHEPAPGLIAVVGCQGRGVGLMTALGPRIAAYLETRDPVQLPLPLTPIRPIPLHRFRRVGVTATIAWYRLRDGLER